MKKTNSIILITIIATFVISMFAFQPTITKANGNVSPSATPSPRKIRKMSRQSIEVENDETHRTQKLGTKVKTKKPAYKEGGVNDTTHRTRKSKTTTKGYQAMPDLDANSNSRKRKLKKSSKNEVSMESIERRKPPRYKSTGRRTHKP